MIAHPQVNRHSENKCHKESYFKILLKLRLHSYKKYSRTITLKKDRKCAENNLNLGKMP